MQDQLPQGTCTEKSLPPLGRTEMILESKKIILFKYLSSDDPPPHVSAN